MVVGHEFSAHKTSTMRFQIQTDDDDLETSTKSSISPSRTPASVRRAISSFSESFQTGTANVVVAAGDVAGVTKAALNRAVEPVILAGEHF